MVQRDRIVNDELLHFFTLYFFILDVTADTALSLEGKGRLDYHISQKRKWEYMMRRSIDNTILEPQSSMESIEVKFRTRSKSGVLIHIQESSNYTTVKVRPSGFDWAACYEVVFISPEFAPVFYFRNTRVLTSAGHYSSYQKG